MSDMNVKMTGPLQNLPGWERGVQGLGLTMTLMSVIVATMFFSFWVFGVGPFSSDKGVENLNSICNQEVKNLDQQASGNPSSENYSSAVTSLLNKLQSSAGVPSSATTLHHPADTSSNP